MSRTVKLNPLWVLLAVLIGAQLGSIVGALFAIPTAGAIQVLVREVMNERKQPRKAGGQPHTHGTSGANGTGDLNPIQVGALV